MFDTAFYKLLNAIGDICERTCHKVLFYVVNKFQLFDLRLSLCSRYNHIKRIAGK